MRVSPIQEIDGRLVLPAAPETENDAARLQDAVSHMVVSSTDTVTVDDELYGPRNPGNTHLVILFAGVGEKRVVLATAYDGQTITIVKNDDASSIVLEPSGDGPTFRGSSSDATIQTSIAERRAFTIAALGDDYDYVGIPREHVTLALALANDPDAGGATITGLGAPSGPTSPVRVQDDAHHLVVNSTDTAVIDAALLGGRSPENTHVLVRFTGGGVKTLEIASDLTASTVNGMLITVSARSSSSFSVNVDVKDGDFEGRSGPVEVSAPTTGAVGFTIGKFGSSAGPTWAFVGMPRVPPSVAQCQLDGTSVALNGTFDLSLTTQRGGLSVSGNGLVFATPGLYRVSCVGLMVRNSTNPDTAGAVIDLRLGTVGSSGSVVATLRGARNISSMDNEFLVSGQGIFEVTDLNDRLWAQNSVSANITIPFANALIVEKIGPAS